MERIHNNFLSFSRNLSSNWTFIVYSHNQNNLTDPVNTYKRAQTYFRWFHLVIGISKFSIMPSMLLCFCNSKLDKNNWVLLCLYIFNSRWNVLKNFLEEESFSIFLRRFRKACGSSLTVFVIGATKMRISQAITDKSRGQWRWGGFRRGFLPAKEG